MIKLLTLVENKKKDLEILINRYLLGKIYKNNIKWSSIDYEVLFSTVVFIDKKCVILGYVKAFSSVLGGDLIKTKHHKIMTKMIKNTVNNYVRQDIYKIFRINIFTPFFDLDCVSWETDLKTLPPR